MDNNRSPNNYENETKHARPEMVDEAPSILRNGKSKQEQFTQTPPPNYQPPPGYQSPPNYQTTPGYQSPPNYQVPPGAQAAPAYGAMPYYNYQPKKGGWGKGFLIFAIVLAVLVAIGFIANSFFSSLFTSDPTFEIPDEEYIAKISVEGEITSTSSDLSSGSSYNHQFTLDSLDEITKDHNNVALLLYVDSPGGGVYESDQIYNKIKNYQDETKRPVYVAMGQMAASGGYYISAPADKILADRNCFTGSIGVTMGTYYDISEFLAKYGIKAENLTAGENKAMGSMVEPLTNEQRQIYQGLLDEAYNQFTSLIADGRNMDIKDVVKLADGRIYTAAQAKQNGLIDDIATEDEAFEMLKKDNGLDAKLVEFDYSSNSWLANLLITYIGPLADKLETLGQGDLEKAMSLAENNENIPIKYLYAQ